MITPKFSAGLELTPGSNEVLPRATWFASPGKGNLPMVSLGWTSDRLSTPEGQAVFATGTWGNAIGGKLSPFVSVKYGTANERLYFPFGGNLKLDMSTTLQVLYDGGHTHILASRFVKNGVVSLIYARTRYVGIHTSFGF